MKRIIREVLEGAVHQIEVIADTVDAGGDMTDMSIVQIPDDVEFPCEVKQYKVGGMQGLPPTDLYAGTWETLYTDVVKTYDKMKAAGVNVRLHIKEKMGHVYPLWPCPEGNSARKEIAEIIKTNK